MDELCKIALLVLVPAMLGITARLWQISTRLDRLQDDVGRDSNSGMRGASHKRKGQIAMLASHVDLLREKTGMRALDLAEAFRKDDT